MSDRQRSPFPGMDPYLEAHWDEVHHRLVAYAADQLQARLPTGLRARLGHRVFIEVGRAADWVFRPDMVSVAHPLDGSVRVAPTTAPADEPILVPLDDDPTRQGVIEIVKDGPGRRLVTVIEVVSPSNKLPGEGRARYLRLRRELAAAGVNLVEIDLTRRGRRDSVVPIERVPAAHRAPFQVAIRRGQAAPTGELYPIPLWMPLPVIGVPLREDEPDTTLELQPLIEQCYANGAFGAVIDYRAAPVPALEADDAAWADQRLRAVGRR